MTNPTQTTYQLLTTAYNHFNASLFQNALPPCLVTLQRKNKAFGYFAPERFGTRNAKRTTDEIALNPSHFKNRTDEQTLSTLAHEMVHLWQHHFGKPSRNGYHNKEWAKKMHEIGLHPSDTGQPGGKETGQNCSHYILDKGQYAAAFAKLAKQPHFTSLYVELWQDAGRAKKAESKTKYSCPDCDTNAWAKPKTNLICGDCNALMEPA